MLVIFFFFLRSRRWFCAQVVFCAFLLPLLYVWVVARLCFSVFSLATGLREERNKEKRRGRMVEIEVGGICNGRVDVSVWWWLVVVVCINWLYAVGAGGER